MSAWAAPAVWREAACVFVLLIRAAVVINADTNSFNAANSVVSCPELEPASTGGILNCTAGCQHAVCTALAAFFSSTYNSTNTALRPWRDRQGWEQTQSQTCAQILAAPTADGLPAYCGWHGITCCAGGPAPSLTYYGPPGENCTVLNSVMTISLQINGLNGSATDAGFQESIAQLHACGMTRLILPGNALSGSLSDSWGDLVNLTILDLGKNYIHGTIPDTMRRLTKLIKLELNRNALMGSLPEWLSELQFLQWLGLDALVGHNEDGSRGLIGTVPGNLSNLSQVSYFSMGQNSISGSLPADFCHSSIGTLDIHDNMIEGDINQLQGCTGVNWLDISSNKFTGLLPDLPVWPWSGVSWVDLSNNDIEGTIPMALYQLQWLGTVNMANNRLNGTINSAIGRMPNLMSVNFGNNQLTGPLENSIWYLPNPTLVDLSSNMLTGTLSSGIGMCYYITTIKLDNNQLTGRIPAELGIMSNLLSIDLRNNSFSCNGDTANGSGMLPSGQYHVLPCFLRLTQSTHPRPDASYMECPDVISKPRAEAVQNCSGSGVTQLGDLASNLATTEPADQQWHLDPGYYQYSGCKCLEGYQAVWSHSNTVLKCVHKTAHTLEPWFIPTAVITTFIGICILGAVGLLVWLRVTVQLRWKWQRERDLLKYRLKGVPNGGPATIVVTDVERYSELMQHSAAVTTRAMGIHNAILRKAVTAHAGHVIEQEGDSWSVAFHRAVDAAAFCLQVQQALQKSHWPGDLGGPAALKSAGERYASNKADTPDPEPGAGEVYMQQASNLCADASGATASKEGDSQHKVNSANSSSALRAPNVAEAHQRRQGFVAGLLRLTGSKGRSNGVGVPGAGAPGSNTSSRAPSESTVREGGRATNSSYGDGAASRVGSLIIPSRQRRASIESSVSAERESSTTETASKAGRSSSVTWSIRGKGAARTADSTIIRGLRVRMGIASGMLPLNSDITRSPLFELAKAVCDMANGGQVLMDQCTASAVRDWLTVLGGVDHKSYNDQLLLEAHRANVRKQAHTNLLGFLSALFKSPLSLVSQDRDPLSLDMGHFWVPSLASCLEAVTAARTVDHVTKSSPSPLEALLGRKNSLPLGAGHKPLLQLHGSNAAIAAAAVATVHGGEAAGSSSQGLRLHCIVARPLHARAKIWKGRLNLPAKTQQITKGYFEAPGTAASDLGPSGSLLGEDGPCLPPVTMVFAVVEGGKVLVRKKERVAAIVHTVLVRTMQALLLSLPDGYLCREQEAVLKYMVAFREPARAAEWCLLLQELRQNIPWPHEVVEGFASLSANPTASNSGLRTTSSTAGLGARPRLKMGVAEGVPDNISPDHLGRADYLGTSVNLAARIMSAAASAGQIAFCMETAQGLFSTWRYEAEMGLYKGTAAVQQLQPGTCQNGECQFSLSGVEGSTATPGPPTADQSADLASNSLKAAGGRRDSLDLMLPNSHNSQPGQLLASEHQQQAGSHALPDDRMLAPLKGSKSALKGFKLEPIACLDLTSEGTVVSGTRSPAALGPDGERALMAMPPSGGGGSDKRIMLVSAHHIGTYAFKGCGAMDMVSLTSDSLLVEFNTKSAAPSKGAKGTLLMACDGPVLGLQECPVMVPNILTEFRQTWASMATADSQPGSPKLESPKSRFLEGYSADGSARLWSVLSGKQQHSSVEQVA